MLKCNYFNLYMASKPATYMSPMSFQKISIRKNSKLKCSDIEKPNIGTNILDESIIESVFVDHLKLNEKVKDIILLEYLYDFNHSSYLLNKLLKPKTHVLQSPYRTVKNYLSKIEGRNLNDIHMVQTMRWTTKNLIDSQLLNRENSYFNKFNNLKLFVGSTPITFHRINNEFKTLIIGNHFYKEMLPNLDLLKSSKKYNAGRDFNLEPPIINKNEIDNIVEIYNLSGIDYLQVLGKTTLDASEKNAFNANATLKTLYAKATSAYAVDEFNDKINKDPNPKYFFIDCLTSMKLIQKELNAEAAGQKIKYRSKFSMKLQSIFDINPVAVFISENCTFEDKNKKTQLNSERYKDYITKTYPDTLLFDNLNIEQMESSDFSNKGPLTLFEIKIKPKILNLSASEGFQLHDFLDCISNKPSKSIAHNLKFVKTDEMYKYLQEHSDWNLFSTVTCLDATQEQIWSLYQIYKLSEKYSEKLNESYKDL
ncbi:hypothetical protein QEN19_004211 [Hanseniaspora menglaensis]